MTKMHFISNMIFTFNFLHARKLCMILSFKMNFSKNCFRNAIGVSISLDPDMTDLGPNCLQR